MTHPKRAYELPPIVLRELSAAGLKKDKFTFVCALGTHGALTMNDFLKKPGSEIIEQYLVTIEISEKTVWRSVQPNTVKHYSDPRSDEVDLKIVTGCITAPVQAGYSGERIIILSGVAHVDCISHYHLEMDAMEKETTGTAKHHGNTLREAIKEVAGMVGLDFALNMVVNGC